MPYYEQCLRIVEEQQAEMKNSPDVYLTKEIQGNTHQGKKCMFVMRTRDERMARTMMIADELRSLVETADKMTNDKFKEKRAEILEKINEGVL